jgi:ketosteroid isomerase-like protein
VSTARSDQLRALYEGFDFRSAAEGKLDRLFERHLRSDFELHPPPIYPDTGIYRGLEEVRDFFQMLTDVWGEWRIEPERMTEAGNRTVVIVRLHARGRESGASTETSAAHLWDFDGDRAARLEVFIDPDDAFAAAGLRDLQSPP